MAWVCMNNNKMEHEIKMRREMKLGTIDMVMALIIIITLTILVQISLTEDTTKSKEKKIDKRNTCIAKQTQKNTKKKN